jgi:uncharacterized protein YifN (PemK superfamily)
MVLPKPEPGLVLNYAYLWHAEYLVGREEGVKNRPTVIVICTENVEDGATLVTVLPITHSAPKIKSEAIEIPRAIKKHLGLDDDQSWIVISEGNEFIWPGYDYVNCVRRIVMNTVSCRQSSSTKSAMLS